MYIKPEVTYISKDELMNAQLLCGSSVCNCQCECESVNGCNCNHMCVPD